MMKYGRCHRGESTKGRCRAAATHEATWTIMSTSNTAFIRIEYLCESDAKKLADRLGQRGKQVEIKPLV